VTLKKKEPGKDRGKRGKVKLCVKRGRVRGGGKKKLQKGTNKGVLKSNNILKESLCGGGKRKTELKNRFLSSNGGERNGEKGFVESHFLLESARRAEKLAKKEKVWNALSSHFKKKNLGETWCGEEKSASLTVGECKREKRSRKRILRKEGSGFQTVFLPKGNLHKRRKSKSGFDRLRPFGRSGEKHAVRPFEFA